MINANPISVPNWNSPIWDLCSSAYCGIFDLLDEKIGHEKTDFVRMVSYAISAGASLNIGLKVAAWALGNLALLTTWQTACVSLCLYPLIGASFVAHCYVTEALCKRSIEQILEKNAQNTNHKETAVVVQARPLSFLDNLYNHYGYEFSLRRQIRKIGEAFSLQLFYIQSLKEWDQALDQVQDASVSYLKIGAHGAPHAITLNEKQNDFLVYFGNQLYKEENKKEFQKLNEDLVKKIDASHDLMKKIETKLKPNAKIILDSCSTGRGENSIQEGFKVYCPQATVYAPFFDIRTTYLKNDLTPLFC